MSFATTCSKFTSLVGQIAKFDRNQGLVSMTEALAEGKASQLPFIGGAETPWQQFKAGR